jgi:hypothetical protein
MARSIADFGASAAREPYELDLGGGNVVAIPHPTGDTWWRLLPEAHSYQDVLRVLAGEHAEAILEALAPLPVGALTGLVTDMREYFLLGKADS